MSQTVFMLSRRNAGNKHIETIHYKTIITNGIIIIQTTNGDRKMSDIIIKGRSANNEVRFFAAYTKELVEKSRTIHNTSPICTAALGRLLTAGAMMGTMAKNESDMLTLIIEGNGPARKLTVTADSKGNVKGLINTPVVDLPPNLEGHLNVGDAIGDGFLRVIRDAGLKEPYIGQTNLVTGEIAEDLTYYFATSEQIPTSVGLGVLMNADNTVAEAGGFIIQLMPFASDDTITKIEKGLASFSSVTDYLSGNTADTHGASGNIRFLNQAYDGTDKTGGSHAGNAASDSNVRNAQNKGINNSVAASIVNGTGLDLTPDDTIIIEKLASMVNSIISDGVTVDEAIPAAYSCNCSRERVKKALISVGKKELQSMINDGQPVNLHCEFCNTDYTFSIDELKSLL